MLVNQPFLNPRNNFFRAFNTVSVSVEVMWKFVENQIQDRRTSRQWWVDNVATGENGLSQSSWQYNKITQEEPGKWDISVLCAAIVNCSALQFDVGQKGAVRALKDVRNRHIGHNREGEMGFDEYIEVLKTSIDNYEKLLTPDELQLHIEKLRNGNYRKNRFVRMYVCTQQKQNRSFNKGICHVGCACVTMSILHSHACTTQSQH